MYYTQLSLSDLRKEFKDRFPTDKVAGKGITKAYLIEKIQSFDAATNIGVSPEEVKKYYKVANDSETFVKLEEAINIVPNPNKFSKYWTKTTIWNTEQAWIEYHREMQLIGENDEDLAILERIQDEETFSIKTIPEDLEIFANKYPITTWVVAYLQGGSAFYTILNKATEVSDILPFKQHIHKNIERFLAGTSPAVREYVMEIITEIITENQKNLKIKLQSLLDAPITGIRQTFESSNKQYTIPKPGDILYIINPYVSYQIGLITSVRLNEKNLTKTYYTFVLLKQKGLPSQLESKDDLELPDNLNLYKFFPTKDFRHGDLLFLPKVSTEIEHDEIMHLMTIPIDKEQHRETFTNRKKIHTVPIPGDILHVKTLYVGHQTVYTDHYYLVISVEKNNHNI